MHLLDSNNQATSGDANAVGIAFLPRDVIASILLCLPASDLRRFRLVCKEWRDIISETDFMDAHMDRGPRAPTHTIVVFPEGSGFLFNEQWRLTATFTAGGLGDMVGTCNGLLCFLDAGSPYRQGAINVVEPFTGESLTVPLPTKTKWSYQAKSSAYCFGFDSRSRRYKIVYKGLDDTIQQKLQVYTVRGGDDWRRVHVPDRDNHCGPVCADGAVYWSMTGRDWLKKLVRFDLATEEIILSESIWDLRLSDPTPALDMMTRSDPRVLVMTMRDNQEWNALIVGEGGRWVQNIGILKLPGGRDYVARPQAFQQGHLLLEDHGRGGLYAHPFIPASRGLGLGKLLLESSSEKEPAKCSSSGRSTPGLFVPVPLTYVPAVTFSYEYRPMTFGYVPTVSPASLAYYFGSL